MPLRGALLDEFGRHEEIYPNDRAPIRGPTPRSSLDEFPAGYSLTRCSPAELVSASPAGIQHDAALAQVRAYFNEETMNKIASRIKTVLQT